MQIPAEQNLLQSLRNSGFSIRALCGERGICGSCKVRILAGEIAINEADAAYFSATDLAAGWRLACLAQPESDITLELPASGEEDFAGVSSFMQDGFTREILSVEEMELAKSKDSIAMQIAKQDASGAALDLSLLQAAGQAALPPGKPFYVARYGGKIIRVCDTRKKLYAIGIDIGTTTIGFALVDLQNAGVTGRLSLVNRQREYGADVVTRIVKANQGELSTLSTMIRTQLAEGASRLCREYGVDPQDVVKVAVAGNTTMLHLLLELNCGLLGSFPFTPVTLDALHIPWSALFGADFSCDVDILPGISTYVGADITAGLLSLMMHKSVRPAILLDIGTNGEMALARDGEILCTSTAAGPALEGVNIAWGTGSVPGAISSIQYENGGFTVSTIGGQPPIGICGSGVIDGVYQFLRHGVISETGRFQDGWTASGSAGAVIAKTVSDEEIYFSQKDIREVQLAKSAIRSGIEILLRHAELRCEDIDTLYIAGGFGFHIDFKSGVGIGLVPAELESKIKIAGNSSLGGVVRFLLDPAQEEALGEIIRAASEFSLSEDDGFQDMFVEYMSF